MSSKTCACLSIYVTKLVRVSLSTCIMVPWALALTPSMSYDSAHCAHMCPPAFLAFATSLVPPSPKRWPRCLPLSVLVLAALDYHVSSRIKMYCKAILSFIALAGGPLELTAGLHRIPCSPTGLHGEQLRAQDLCHPARSGGLPKATWITS